MQITGERTVPGIPEENYWFRRHEAVYQYVCALLGPAATVLEAGCGEGYGARMLAEAGHLPTLLDYDDFTVRHVRKAYPSMPIVRGNLVALPFADRSFDALVSLQTIEHLWDQPRFAAECHRVSRGLLVLSTPNRLTFPPGNIFHTRELSPDQLRNLLDGHEPTLLGLHHGPRIRSWEASYGDLVAAQIAAQPAGWDPELAGFVASLTTADFELSERGLDRALDLIAITGG
jgi:SAM-dependent methyltransferase